MNLYNYACMALGQLDLGLVNVPNFQSLITHSILTFGNCTVLSKHGMALPASVFNCDFGATLYFNCRQKEKEGDGEEAGI